MKPLVDKEYLLQKMKGKGGWTYAEIPEIIQDKTKPFGWVTVRGSIDDYEFEHFKLMPMGNGKLFFSVKSAIRKKIKKQAGDSVHIILYPDNNTYVIPEEILTCFESEDSTLLHKFKSLTEGEQKVYVDWIYSAKTDDTKTNRIVQMLEKVQLGKKFQDE